ncbi:Carboxylesterase [Mycena rebaudengoi]|nr:Carboxylesterase [Mycena rebaudengoi]
MSIQARWIFPFNTMRVSLALAFTVLVSVSSATPVLVPTTSGLLQGSKIDGISTFKGIRFAQPATGLLRWEPPVPFVSTRLQNASGLGPSCVQQFSFASSDFVQSLFNNPPPPENEDCLFINVWAPSSVKQALPVLVWIYGGGLAFGTASLAGYDGTSLATSQGIIVVTFNYRTNVFGFPGSPDLPLEQNNLGFLDQELAFIWVQKNIARFGGDPRKVTIMGQSAGSLSVADAIQRHTPDKAPFRAGIMLSGAAVSVDPTPSFTSFNNFSTAVGCKQAPGPSRLACLKRVPTSVIRNYTNGPASGSFRPVSDGVTAFSNPLSRIRTGLTARVPFIIGNMADDGSLSALGMMNLPQLLSTLFGGQVTADQVRPLYPGLNDSMIISEIFTGRAFQCPAQLWSNAAVGAGVSNVFRYTYGAVFADLQKFPGAGAWHSSEIPEIFGTFNAISATAPEVTLSQTMQTIVGNFVKNPISPAPNWPRYVQGSGTNFAKLAYDGNVQLSDVVQAAQSDSIDGPCNAFLNKFLDF